MFFIAQLFFPPPHLPTALLSPIHTVMRLVEHDGLIHDGMSIPRGHFICAGLTVGHYTESRFESPNVFDARRAYGDSKEEWTLAGVDVATKSARNLYLPFGAG